MMCAAVTADKQKTFAMETGAAAEQKKTFSILQPICMRLAGKLLMTA
jgi:hypothetical protein